jgi:hypothetical protein
VSWVQHWWPHARETEFLRTEGFHLVIAGVQVSRRDPAFVSVTIEPSNRAGTPAQAAQIGLVRVAGEWKLIVGPGTDEAVICRAPSPHPLEDLYCPRS